MPRGIPNRPSEPETPGVQPEEPPRRAGSSIATGRKATLDEIRAWEEEYRAVALADDDEAKALKRALASKLKRLTHAELHPDCPDVTIDVPLPRGAVGPQTRFFMINEQPYFGRVTVPRCVAQTLLAMIAKNADVEERTLQDRGNQVVIDQSGIVNRIQRIRAAG